MLDVGCGEGTLARQLRGHVDRVIGLDVDREGIELARSLGGGVDYVCADLGFHPFDPGSFDAVVSVATVHHLDLATALRRMRELVRPGGVIVVVGLAARSLSDLPYDAAGFFAHRWIKARRGYWQHPSPVIDPSMTYREIRRVVAAELPGARCRRHVMFRYSVVWTKPAG